LKASPNNVTAALGLIRIYRKQDETAKALELAKATRKLAPTDPLVAHQVGRLAFETGDFSWAFSLLQETVAKDPKDPTALFDFALASYSQGNVPAATNALREALEANSGFPQAERARQVLDLVSLAADPKGTTEAKAKVDRALKADERDVPALMALGTIAEQSRNTNGAREAYEKALSRFPDFSPAQRRLAILYSQAKGDEAKGVVYATKARAAYPEDADLAKAFGILMYRQGNFSRAQSLLQESMRRLSTDGELMYYLGMAQKNLKDATASIKSLNRALELGLSAELASEAKRTLSAK
jgi:Flp pilus assembly protein TadD